jgi:hypothetical protein
MNEDFNLVYYHKETGKEYRVKKITRLNVRILDPETGAKLDLSKYALDKSFKADKDNGKRQKKIRLNFKNWDKD